MKSVGGFLIAARKNKKLTLEDIHKFTKIHPKYLKALEDDDYGVFSGKIHAKGFLRIYAEFLGLNVDQILAFWRREYEAVFDDKERELDEKLKARAAPPSKLIVTPSLVVGVLGALLITVFFGYLFYQYRTYSGAPKLEIYSPQNSIVVTDDILDITGKTDRDSVLLINNQRVILNMDGTFVTSIKLNEGLSTISIKSVNKLGKESQQIRTIIFRQPEESIESTQPAKNGP